MPRARCGLRGQAAGPHGWRGPAVTLCEGVGEWDGRVGQLGPVGGGAGVDQGLDVVGDVPDVDVHAGHDLAVGQPEGDVLAAGEVAPDHHVVGLAGADVTGVLHAEVVLVGVEVGQPVVGGVLAEHGAGGDGGLVEGVRPVFDPDVG